MFDKVLVANRGEIAVRILRACREMGIKTVAVYSKVDKDAFHVHIADEAVCIGPADPRYSYLNIPSIMSAAEISGASAIHPGYGFLSENAHFSEVCQACDIVFIGPDPHVIRDMGNKTEAKIIMKKAGVPLIEGSDGVVKDVSEIQKIVERIGTPVILKASAGGGGRGMFIIDDEKDIERFYKMASLEAEHAFADPSIYVEKYIREPRHVEIQIMADAWGNCVYFGERECSLQRRHQKILEEAPCFILPEDVRKKMGEVAVNAAKDMGYVGAGTVEFLLDKDNNFYFIEMNTRIQVEHPVTEMVTGFDLVKEQIRVAAGEKLSVRQEDIQLRGAAIECRINAEDIDNNFLPSVGTLKVFHLPGGPNVRIDTYCYQDYKVSPHYDSLLCKLIVKGETREEAISVLRRALDETIIEGVKTTLPFFKEIVFDERFLKADIHTGYVDEFMEKRFQ